jgi:predicted dehydrogenase
MRFALLGADDDALELARAVGRSGRHEVVRADEAKTRADEISKIAPRAACGEHWAELLHGSQVEGVIVARGDDAQCRDEQLRKFVQAEVPLLVVHPACESIVGLELLMIGRDTRSLIVPYVPGMGHPGIGRLLELARAGPTGKLGRLEQIVFERGMPQRGHRHVLPRLSRDVHLLAQLLGEVQKVAALGSPLNDEEGGPLGVQLWGPEGVLALWSLVPSGQEFGQVVLVGRNGRATLRMGSGNESWRLKIELSQPAAHIETEDYPPFDDAALAIDEFARRARLDETGESRSSAFAAACRSMEIAESVETSLARGRTVELRQGEPSEEATFMGIMAVGGCGLLVLIFVGLVAAAIVEGLQLPLRDALAWRLWPVYLAGLLAVFLLSQLFKLVFPRRSSPSEPGQSSPPHRDDLSG